MKQGKYQECIELLKDKSETNNVAFLSLCLGFSYKETGNSYIADSLIHRAADIFKEIGNNSFDIYSYKEASKAYHFAEKLQTTIADYNKTNYSDILHECESFNTSWDQNLYNEIIEKKLIPFGQLLTQDDIRKIMLHIYLRATLPHINLETGELVYNSVESSEKEKLLLLINDMAYNYFGKKSDEYVNSLLYLADYYHSINSDKTNYYYKEVEKILKSGHLKNAASFFSSLGDYYMKQNDYKKAESYYIKSYISYKDSANSLNPIGYLIDYYKRVGNWEKAFIYQQEFDTWATKTYYYDKIEINKEIFSPINFSFFPGLWSEENILQIVDNYPSQKVTNHAYNVMLFFKGIELQKIRNTRNAVYQSNNQTLKNSYRKLFDIYDEIDTLQNRKDIPKIERCAILVKLDNARDSLREIVKSLLMNEIDQNNTITWEDVKSNLSNNEAAIEFVNFSQIDYNKSDTVVSYAALLLRKDSEAPIYIPLFEKSQIDLLLNDKNPILEKRFDKLFNGSNILYQLIWQPLEKYLQGIETVYYSPSGVLNKISFAAIPVDTTMLADKYNLHLVSSTREVVNEKKQKETLLPVKQAVEYGGITYDAEDSDLLAAAEKTRSTNKDGWGPLEKTEIEVDSIENILTQHGVNSIKYKGIEATEESFKKLSGNSPEILHVATHGFFLKDTTEIKRNKYLQTINNDNNRVFLNPLLRSGLIFAGANRAWKQEDILPGIDDGILTAEEIANLDLSNIKLVVLSACETGLGEVTNNEGVFGLQRAFKLAGVETLVMSLWKVDDEATSIFMIDFYQNLLSGMSKQDAFRKAQQTVRKDREKFKNPYYWAGFVMMD